MPRPYVDATSVFVNALGLKICSAVTGAFGRNPDTPGPGAGPASAQLAAAVELTKTPTSVPAYTIPACASTSNAFTGLSGNSVAPVPVQSVQLAPAFEVFHTCDVGYPAVLNPIIPT